MDEMVSSVSHVNDHMHELAEAVESTSSSIQEMSATIKQVAINAEELATASQETLSAISEITSTIREVELTARESARLSERATSDAATLGMASVEKTIGGMERIKASVERTAEFIQRLGGRSDEIGTILTVIDEVTDQTTLLALNAAILAAQAGEHGKGFSVVADEIKDLAERTAFSTQEIGALIQSVQQEVKYSVEAMQEGLRSVEEGFRVTKEAESALSKILDGSKQTSEMAISIERSTAEQSRAAKFVAEAMERVRNMTDQIAKSTMEQSKGILLIMKATEKMRDISRLASKATEEQTSTSRQISQAMELVSERSQQISHSLSHHKAGTRQILSTVDTLKKIPLEKRDHAFKISNTIEELHRDAQLLRAEVERFTLSGSG
jgi:methyl-accepting chemotaxis protein